MIKILEVDQWSSTGDITKFTMSEWENNPQGTLNKISGGDAKAARSIFGGHVAILMVEESQLPSIGNVWFREMPNSDGKHLVKWRCTYDSSD